MTARVRLGLALGAVLLALGVAWTTTAGSPGFLSPGSTTLTNQYNYSTGDLDLVTRFTPGYYLPGSPGSQLPGYQSDVRVGLVPAALALMWALLRPSTQRRSALRVAAALLAVSALWGVGHGLVRGPTLALLATGLVVSGVRRYEPATDHVGSAAAPATPPAGATF